MAQHNDTGAWGEDVARQYLVANGYAIFDHNTHVGRNEVDIVAIRDGSVAFVEVKTRSSALADPLKAVTPAKQRRLARAADSLLRTHNLRQRPQFDIITIVGKPGNYTLEHIPDAFLPPLITTR